MLTQISWKCRHIYLNYAIAKRIETSQTIYSEYYSAMFKVLVANHLMLSEMAYSLLGFRTNETEFLLKT